MSEERKTEGIERSGVGRIIRLTGRRPKGLLRILFSRTLVVVVLILLQIVFVFNLFGRLEPYAAELAAAKAAVLVVMVFYLFGCDMDSSAKLTWMFLIAVIPLPASLFLGYTRLDPGHRMVRRRSADLIAETKEALPKDRKVLADLEEDRSGTDDLCRYLNRTGCFPICEHTAVTYFPMGIKKFEAMLEELEKAEKFIFLEYFIVEEGYMWGRILDVLARKAAEGVDVRLLYDGMCELLLLPHDYPKRLEKLGIKAKPYAPLLPVFSTAYNYRDHRKILVIDGKTAFNGGINLADEYIEYKEVYGRWKDTAVMLKGEAVRSFTLMFLQMWNIDEPEPEFSRFIEADCGEAPTDGFVMPYGDSPLDDDKVGESVYIDILNRATEYVHIMTPYLILDGEMEHALRFAAQRGVDVKIILPGIPDKKLAWALAKSHYRNLTRAGVKIYEYKPGFVHAKTFVADGVKGVVGTINLDYRSLYHHFECATYLYKCSCIAAMERDFEQTLPVCREVTPESMKNEKLFYKAAGRVMRLIAPLM